MPGSIEREEPTDDFDLLTTNYLTSIPYLRVLSWLKTKQARLDDFVSIKQKMNRFRTLSLDVCIAEKQGSGAECSADATPRHVVEIDSGRQDREAEWRSG